MQALTTQQLIGVRLVRALSATAFSLMALRKFKVPVRKREFRYGPQPDERLDYLLPVNAELKPIAAVVYLHGGGWISCSKRYYPADLQFLCEAGYTVFNVEYPLAPEHPHPQMLHSVLRALAWIKREYPQLQKIHMMGDSAGANLAAMYCVMHRNPELLTAVGNGNDLDELPVPATLVSLYGLMDRLTLIGDDPEQIKPVVRLFLQSYGGPAVLTPGPVVKEQAITPMDLDWQQHPPCFLGGGDIDFLRASSVLYAKELRARQIPVVHIEYPDAPHGFFNMRHAQTPVLKRDVLKFLADYS